MRMVEKATPRVKVFSIGKTEEGREMIAVARIVGGQPREARGQPCQSREAGGSACDQDE
jgi:hypothetical protein